MARHGCEELVPLDREQLERLERPHRGATRDVAQKGDLAEELPWPELPGRAVVEVHDGFPTRDRVEVVTRLAARDNNLVGCDRDGRSPAGEALEHGLGQLREDRDSPQQLEWLLRDHCLVVDPSQAWPERDEQDG